MVAGKNYNIVTKSVSVGSSLGIAAAVGSSVAAGMTRYVTFIAISPRTGSATCGRRIYFNYSSCIDSSKVEIYSSFKCIRRRTKCSLPEEN
jgi:hypothetical protein